MNDNFNHWLNTRARSNPVGSLTLCVALFFVLTHSCRAQDQFVFYFPGSIAVGNLGGVTFDSAGNFWVISRDQTVSATPRISKVSNSGSGWSSDPYVLEEDLRFFYRSSNLASGFTNPNWGGPISGTPASFMLNPAALTITIPTGLGGTTQKTYQPGELAFITDAMGTLVELPSGTQRLDATKKLIRYDLRKVDNPFGGVNGTTNQQPDFANAANNNGSGPTLVFGAHGVTDWNDAFTVVFSEQDLQDATVESLTADFNGNRQVESADLAIWQNNYGMAATGSTGDANGNAVAEGRDFLIWQRQFGLRDGGSNNFGRSFAWSSDGQSIYAIDAGANTGGIYRIDATQEHVATRIWIGTKSNESGGRINSEPAVIHTSVRDLDPANLATGDQILVEGSADGGNDGGINIYLDTGASTMAQPTPLFTETDFRSFAEYVGDSAPQYLSLTTDAVGNLYFHETGTDGVYVYDTQGRLAKVASEAEHNEFQTANGLGLNDNVLDMQVRTSTTPGFAVNEIIFTDDAFDAPIGIRAYKTGDFDRDNDLDATDLSLFSAALGIRGAAADPAEYKFDLNGNAVLAFDPVDMRFEHVTNGPTVVDWKDVKILQQFVDIKDGDANFDGAVDFLDLDIMSLNYYTLAGQTMETWINGDFASIDPNYAIDAVDGNLVNTVDLEVIADTWVNQLGQTPVTAADANMRGYAGQFRTDLLAAFADALVLSADFNQDTFVNGLDLLIWQTKYGSAGNNSMGDADGDGFVTGRDFLFWQRQHTGAPLGALAVPEPTALSGVLFLLFSLAIVRCRTEIIS